MKRKDPDREKVRAARQITILNELGLHARPAAEFVRQANVFRSEIWLVTARGKFSALSLIDVMRANLERGAVATLEAIGPDAIEAVERLDRVVRELHDFP
jgi:phosphocarrier protein HPr